MIDPGHESYLHHMVLYECHAPSSSSSNSWFDSHVGAPGAACYSPNMPPEWNFCLATNTWAWAVGSGGQRLPEHVGIPLGEDHGGATYFMLETHYDNPSQHSGVKDSSGIRIYYTDEVREYDASMLLLGSEVNFLHVIPPGQQDFSTLGRCSSSCTEAALPQEGIRLFSAVLHSHLAGRAISLRHIRNNKELPVIFEDGNYDFNFQASRRPEGGVERIVLPGDELLLECGYDTSDRSNLTFGGLSTREEMCLAFVLYYPRSELADCRSLPTPESVLAAFGVKAVQADAFQRYVDITLSTLEHQISFLTICVPVPN